MPVCMIEGPSGLSKDSKKELMRKTLESLVNAYQMPDDRVFVKENFDENIGHTSHAENVEYAVQSGKARPVCMIQAPQGLPLDAKRVLMSDLTDHIAHAYGLKDLRDVLILIQEYPLDVVANNGLLQSENPEFASPSTN
jgi:phenylpyruvate tautomerase PptA (4-oxalocrotonate tautomerase family)